MHAARVLAASRQGYIDSAPGEVLLELCLLEANPMHLERRLDRGLRIVYELARGWTFGGRERPQTLELLRQQPLFAQQTHPHLVQRGQRGGRFHVRERLLDEC